MAWGVSQRTTTVSMKYTDENVMALAQKIVDAMDLDDLMSYVYDDLCECMDKDEELFQLAVESHHESTQSNRDT